MESGVSECGGRIEATSILLARGRQEKWDFVFVAEAWEGKNKERTTQQGYRVFCEAGSRLILYVPEEVDLHRLGARVETSEKWIAVGDLVADVYLSPNINVGTLKESLMEICNGAWSPTVAWAVT